MTNYLSGENFPQIYSLTEGEEWPAKPKWKLKKPETILNTDLSWLNIKLFVYI